MAGAMNYLDLDDDALLRQCEIHAYRSSGPGGQHRNKVSSAIRLHHRPTALTAHGDDSRSQHDNKRMALQRLRGKIACGVRQALDPASPEVPPAVEGCLFVPRKAGPEAKRRLEVGRRDQRFWPVAAFLLDLLEAHQGRLAEAAGGLDITTSNLVGVLKSDPQVLTAAQAIRKAHGQGPVK